MLTRKEQEANQLKQIKALCLEDLIIYDLEVEGVTHCFLVDTTTGQVPAIGLAIQSPEDQLNRRVARLKARARAIRAVKTEARRNKADSSPIFHSSPINTDRYFNTVYQGRYQRLREIYGHKSTLQPRLRTEEQKAVKNFLTKLNNYVPSVVPKEGSWGDVNYLRGRSEE